jgi:hypothetical protein
MTDEVAKTLQLLDQFEKQGVDRPAKAEKLVADIFRACGHDVTETGFVEAEEGVDCFFRTKLDGKEQLIGVEVRSNTRPVPAGAVEDAFNLKRTGQFDRVMVIASGGFTPGAIYHADSVAVGQIDLLGPNELRSWIIKANTPANDPFLTNTQIIVKAAMEGLAKEVARNPEALWEQNWLDLERLLYAAFKGVGFEAILTRPAKDGGFDLELTFDRNGAKEVHLVEVKHWKKNKPGKKELTKLIRVTAERKSTGGVLLSSSGFTTTICSGIVECERPIRLGNSDKIVGVCKTYARLDSAVWTLFPTPYEMLTSETRNISEINLSNGKANRLP